MTTDPQVNPQRPHATPAIAPSESDGSGGNARSGALPSALAGIGLMLASMACFAVSDVFAKQALVRHSGAEIAWYRYAGLAIVVLAMAFRQGPPPRSPQPRLQLGRGLGLVGSTLFFNVALKVLPLAETTALAFASPLFVTLVSAFALRERVGLARWAIVVTGFAGVLIVMRPGSPAFQAAALLPLLGACSWAIGVGFSRKSISHDSVATTTAYSCMVGLAVLSVIVIPGFVVPTLGELVALTLMSATWSVAQWLNLSAFHRAEASLLAPFAYSQLFWATLLGYLVFAHVPDGWSLLGICIIVGSGVVAAISSRHPVAVRGARTERNTCLMRDPGNRPAAGCKDQWPTF